MVKATKKRVVKKAKRKVKKLLVLPRKMSALIKIALRDIRKAEKSAAFVVDMREWYEPNQEIVCRVGDSDGLVISKQKACVACAAGSVMAFSFGLGPDGNPDKASNLLGSEENGMQLSAIDSLRRGAVASAARELDISYDQWEGPERDIDDTKKLDGFFEKLNSNIPDYDNIDPKPFHEAMEKLQAKLEKAGL